MVMRRSGNGLDFVLPVTQAIFRRGARRGVRFLTNPRGTSASILFIFALTQHGSDDG